MNFLDYAAANRLALFPLPAGSKAATGGFKNQATTNPEQWKEWRAQGYNIGIYAAASGLIIADIDTKAGRDEAWATWCQVCADWGTSVLMPQTTSPSGGWHVYLSVPEGVDPFQLRQPDAAPGINLRVVGYTVAPGSTFEGRPYSLISDAPPHPAPALLVERCTRRPKPEGVVKPGNYAKSDVSALLAFLNSKGGFASYEDWLHIGMALRVEYGDDGFALWSETFDDTVTTDAAATKWESFASVATPDSVTLNTFMKRAHAQGWRGSLQQSAEDMFAGIAASVPPPPVPAPGATDHLPLTFFRDVRNKPRLRYLVKGFMAEGATSTIYGAPKTNKSTMAVDVGVHVATGQDWRGHKIKQARGVVYFAFERATQVEKALEAYAVRDGLDDNIPFAICPRLIDMIDPGCVELIVNTIRAAEAHFGIPVGLAVFDTWNKGIAAGGGSEDKAEHQNAAAANLRRIIEAIPALHCLTIGHTGKDATRGERGSNATQGDRDVGVLLEASGNARLATIDYANDLPEGRLTLFEGEAIEIGQNEDGEAVTGFIVDRRELSGAFSMAPQAAAKPRKLSDQHCNVFEALQEAMKGGAFAHPDMPEKSVSLGQWREVCMVRALLGEQPARALDRAINALTAHGMIMVRNDRVRIIHQSTLSTPDHGTASNVPPPIPTRRPTTTTDQTATI